MAGSIDFVDVPNQRFKEREHDHCKKKEWHSRTINNPVSSMQYVYLKILEQLKNQKGSVFI